MSASRIPLHDFLAANRLGKRDLRFGASHDENDTCEPGKKAAFDATRLALMVAESYVLLHKKTGLNCNDNDRAAPLDLDCVYLVVPSEGSAESDNHPGHSKDMEGIHDEGILDLSDTDFSFREELLGGANIDAFGTFPGRLDGSDKFDVLGILNEAGFESSNRDNIFDSTTEIDNGYKFGSAGGDYSLHSPGGDFEKNEVTGPGTPTTTSQTTSCSPDPSSVDVILGVEIASMENETYPEVEFHAALRMLGGVLQQIFLSTVPEIEPTTSAVLKDAPEFGRRVDFQRQGRSASRPRLDKSSVLSSLSERLPFSVCRLLSDMIEPAVMPEDGVRIETFVQVVDDLLSMSESPSLYLFDPSADFHSSLIFGQRCHGRKEELTALLGVATRIEECTRRGDDVGKAQVVLVSGKGGSGKSHLVGHVSTFISELGGWNVYRAKFRRGAVHESKDIASVLFNCVVMDIVAMKDSENREDVEYSRAVSSAIEEVIGNEGVRVLSSFIPSITKLVEVEPEQDASYESEDIERPYRENDMNEYSRVSHLVSALIAVIAKERLICLCFDDLQWAESSTLTMLRQISISVGKDESSRHRFLFLGMYRDNEINDGHPLADEIGIFRDSSSVDLTLLELSPLSKSDIMNMVMSETRLTRRYVETLVDVVHKVTIGHAIFVTQLLTSLVRDSIISYSPLKHRFDWSDRVLDSLSMGGDVASLVVENLSSLQPGALKSLEVLSCFGIQISLQTVRMLQGCNCLPEEGIEPYLDELVEKGVLSREVPLSFLVFSHDLIQQHIYENIPSEERQSLHLEIGTHLGSVLSLDSLLGAPFSRVAPQYPLIAAAVNQVNSSGLICDTHERLRFAQWNALAGKQSWDRSNCDAGLNYFKFGISFLGDAAWQNESQNELCRLLHEGAAACSFTLGENQACLRFASDIITNAAFDVSLVGHYLYIRSLETLGRFSDGLNHGLGVFQKLGFHSPTELSRQAMMSTLERTKEAVYSKTFEELTNPHQHMPTPTRNVYKLLDACMVSANRIASPVLPILACSIINFSLENGLCGEAAVAYVLLGVFRMGLGKYDEVPYYTRIVLAVLDSSPSSSSTVRRARAICYNFLSILHFPFKETYVLMRTGANEALRSGDSASGYEYLRFICTLSVFAGDKLSTVLDSINNVISHMSKAKKMNQSLQLVILEKLLVTSWVSSEEVGPTIDALIEKQKTTNGNAWDIELTLYTRFYVAFWNEEHETALSVLNDLLSGNLIVQLKYVYFKFYHGIIAFRQYRNGEGEEWLDQGKDCLEKFKVWSSLSPTNFQSKLLILEAEYQASEANIFVAKTMFQSAARVARDNGLINDQALACKLYGQFLISIVEYQDAISWLNLSKSAFKDWGATHLQKQVENEVQTLIRENNLHDVVTSSSDGTSSCNLKHERGW